MHYPKILGLLSLIAAVNSYHFHEDDFNGLYARDLTNDFEHEDIFVRDVDYLDYEDLSTRAIVKAILKRASEDTLETLNEKIRAKIKTCDKYHDELQKESNPSKKAEWQRKYDSCSQEYNALNRQYVDLLQKKGSSTSTGKAKKSGPTKKRLR